MFQIFQFGAAVLAQQPYFKKGVAMKYEEYLDSYLKSEKKPEHTSPFLVMGCMEQYLAAETEEKKKLFLEYLSRLTEKSGVEGKNLFVLYDATKEELYREKIEKKMEFLRQCPKDRDGVFCDANGNMDTKPWDFLYEAYPFYMAYETRFHNKADYADFVLQTRKYEPALIQTVTWKDVCFLMSLVEVIDGTSKEIFEHYNSLQEIFKRTVKKIIPPLKNQEVEAKVGLAMGYVIAKACNIKILNSEKYIQIGLDLIEAGEKAEEKDDEFAGLSMMADSMKRQFTKNE